MKKYLLLLAAFGLFFFSSCSSDDDGGETEPTIAGSWRLASVTPPNPFLDLSCPEDATITFNTNGTANWTMYDAQNECEEVSSSGTWEQNSGDNYTVGIPEIGDVEGTVNFTSNNSFTFSTSVQGIPVVLSFVR